MKIKAEGGGKGAAQLPKVAFLFSACFHNTSIGLFRAHFNTF